MPLKKRFRVTSHASGSDVMHSAVVPNDVAMETIGAITSEPNDVRNFEMGASDATGLDPGSGRCLVPILWGTV